MRFFTGTGDSGDTNLMGGSRVPKNDSRVEAFGTIDELNSFIGLAIKESDENISNILTRIQNELFILGAQAADSEGLSKKSITSNHISEMEKNISEIGEGLSQDKFVLPSGNASIFHVCRSVTRRAERRCIEILDQVAVQYLNRLSSLFYTIALKVNDGNETHPTYK